MAAKVKSKTETAVPLEMVPAPTVHLEIDDTNIGTFRAFGKVNQKVLAYFAKPQKSLPEIHEVIDLVVNWLVTYAHADEAELDALDFAGLTQVWTQAGGVYTGAAIPQKKSAP